MINRIDDLTAFRAVFAAWVFSYHVDLQLGRPQLGPFQPLIERGYLGVDGFFVLSGIVLALAHPAIQPLPAQAASFWTRRLARIYPVHLAMILLLGMMLVGGLAVGLAPREPERFGLVALLRSLTLTQAWGLSDRLAWNYPSWSISTEWAGYLLFPLLWPAVRGLPGRMLAILPVLMLATLSAVAALLGDWRLNLTYAGALGRYFPEFVAGLAICRIAPRIPGAPLLAAGAVIAGTAALLGSDVAVVAGLWLALAGTVARSDRPLLARVPGLLGLGTLSYSFYMSFAPLELAQAVVWRRIGVEPANRPLLYVVLTTGGTLALALLAFRFVERPAQRRLPALFRAAAPHLATADPGS